MRRSICGLFRFEYGRPGTPAPALGPCPWSSRPTRISVDDEPGSGPDRRALRVSFTHECHTHPASWSTRNPAILRALYRFAIMLRLTSQLTRPGIERSECRRARFAPSVRHCKRWASHAPRRR